MNTNASSTVLLVGSTGLLGREVAKRLRATGSHVRALVRETADPAKLDELRDLGLEVVFGDLKNPNSLAAACSAASVVISTATATTSRQAGDSIESVDRHGTLALVDAASDAGVGSFVFVSMFATPFDFELQRAKRAVEQRLVNSKLDFSILQPAKFMEVWLGKALGFDPVGGAVQILGDGNQAVSWISYVDVARIAVACATGGEAARRVIPLGGPDALTQLEVLQIFEEVGSPAAVPTFVSEVALMSALTSANDSLAEAYAALMLAGARGEIVPSGDAAALTPGRMITVRDYARTMIAMSQNSTKGSGDV